jgi:hypothetical protein
MQLALLESGKMFNAKTKTEFLSKEEVDTFLGLIQDTDVWEKSVVEFWDNRIISFNSVKDKFGLDAANLFSDIIIRTKDFIIKEYELDRDITTGAISICRWFPGMEQPPHADDMTNTDTKGYEDNAFGSVIYLNENYGGGKTYYPDYGIEVTPETGKLAVHPGDVNHIHGVTKVEENIRYTIASFWKYKV